MKVAEFLTRAAKWYPNKVAHRLVGGDSYTFKQYNDRVNSLSHALLDMGLIPQEKVAIMCHSCPQYMEVIFAAAKTRLICASINWRLNAEGIAFIMKDSEAKVLFYSKRFESMLSQIRPLVSSDVRFISIEGKMDGMTDYNDLINKYPSSEPESMKSLQDDDVYQILYTSGTTGRMKGVMLTNKNSNCATKNFLITFNMDRLSHYLLLFPLFHVANWVAIAAVYGCYTQSFMAAVPFDPGQCLEYMEKEKVTDMVLAVPFVRALLDHPDFEKRDLSSLKLITLGTSATPVTMIREMKQKLNCALTQNYGMTECGGSVSNMKDRDFGRDALGQISTRVASVGVPIIECDVKVFDEEDKECPPGIIGELCVNGENVMKGYHNMPEQTAAVLKNGWYHSGDLGYKDDEGFLYIVDRKNDMIVSGGENVYPNEVEEVIRGMEGIGEVSVVGLPDRKWGDSVTAFIVPKPGTVLTEAMVIDYCKDHIAGYKKPRKVYFVNEIPKNAAGKALRRELRSKYSKEI